jgi:soluble lytic murein transglycosylase
MLFLGVTTFKTAAATDVSVKMWDGLNAQDVKTIKNVAILIDNNAFDKALARSEMMKSGNKHLYQALRNIVLWNKYSQDNLGSSVAFSDISRFAMDNRYFPRINKVERNIEKLVISNKIPASSYDRYFLQKLPENSDVKTYILEEKVEFIKNYSGDFASKEKKLEEVQLLVSDIWINHNFSQDEEDEFLLRYNGQLSEIDHVKRIDRLLWEDQFDAVDNMMDLVGDHYKKLFTAIIKISKSPKYINNIILSVPRKLRGYEHLQYRRAMFHHKNDNVKDLVNILSNIPKGVKKPLKWWKLRNLYGRELLKPKKYKEAYRVVSRHGLNQESNEYTEAEWLSGWIALRFLNNPIDAIVHFKNMHDNVSYPISVSRASYWLGASYEALGQKEDAVKWYKDAANYPTYFYGQVAIHKYRSLTNEISLSSFSLPKEPVISENDIKIISYKTALRVAYLLILMNDKEDGFAIIKKVIKGLNSKGKIGAIIKLVEEIGGSDMTHKVYRYTNRKNVFFIDKQYKIIEKIKNYPNAALIHSLIKQESGFSPGALSSVGAVGFMQVMPDTAKQVAKKLKIRYSSRKLATDIDYNIKIGSYYVNSLLDKFDDSKILAIASYNAGPSSSRRWIKEFYDPRDYSKSDNYDNNDLDKVIDWVELITYGETRNYVHRVMENLLVYNYLMS